MTAKKHDVSEELLNRPDIELPPIYRKIFKKSFMAKSRPAFELKVVHNFLAGEGGAKVLAYSRLIASGATWKILK